MAEKTSPEVEIVYDRPPHDGERVRSAHWPQLSLDIDALARLMDSIFHIPGLNVRFGLDAIVGLLPGIGDAATSLVSFYILHQANERGVPRITLARMALNLAVDYIVGAVPFVGDLFDMYWKANQRNAALLAAHLAAAPAEARRLRRGDRIFVGLLIASLVALLVSAIVLAILIVGWLVSLLSWAISG